MQQVVVKMEETLIPKLVLSGIPDRGGGRSTNLGGGRNLNVIYEYLRSRNISSTDLDMVLWINIASRTWRTPDVRDGRPMLGKCVMHLVRRSRRHFTTKVSHLVQNGFNTFIDPHSNLYTIYFPFHRRLSCDMVKFRYSEKAQKNLKKSPNIFDATK